MILRGGGQRNLKLSQIIRGVAKAWFSDTIRAGFANAHTAPYRKFGFTLAEVLITLGVIGVVAAITLPTLNQAINKKVRAEQIRTVKYKFTKATEKMASLGLIGPYDSTAAFVAELQKHLKIMKVCTSNNLRACWPYDTVTLQDGKEWDISKTQTGKNFMMQSNDTQDYSSPNIGIITADGTPMLLSYNTKCEALDPVKTYGWSTEDNKPVSNATSNCVAAVFEVNGMRKPNKFSEDVIAFNANGLGNICSVKVNNKCFGAVFSPTPVTRSECKQMKADGLGIGFCRYDNDYWAGAVKRCGGVKNLPSLNDFEVMRKIIYCTYTDTSKCASFSELGLPEPDFSLWGPEGSGQGTYGYTGGFGATSGGTGDGARRSSSSSFAICKVD